MSELESMSQVLEGVLGRYRSPSGNLDYFSMMGDQAMIKYAEGLSEFDPDTLTTRNEKLAFWINCYNALTIYGVTRKLKDDPKFIERGNSSWWGRVKFFALQKFSVGGKEYTLRDIENLIRKEFRDPRIHFALNCASSSCPLLKDGLYSGENLDQELESAAELYIRSAEGALLNRDDNVLYLSMIFKWYKKDFESTGKTLLEYISQYMSENEKSYLQNNKDKITIRFNTYDWALNNMTPEGEKVA